MRPSRGRRVHAAKLGALNVAESPKPLVEDPGIGVHDRGAVEEEHHPPVQVEVGQDQLPAEVIEEHGDRWTDPGTLWSCGPFMLDTWEHDARMVFVKNPHYFNAQSVSIETVNVHMVEASTALMMYEAGQLDMAGIPFQDLPRLLADPERSKEVHVQPSRSTFYIGFNLTKPPVDNALVRKALASAFDRQKLVDSLLKGGQKAAKTFAPAGIFGSPAENPDFKGIPFDPEQARKWLAEAGYPGGEGLPELGMMFTTSEGWRTVSEFMQKEWKEHLGIDVKLASMEWKAYLARIRTDPSQLWLLGWAADYLDENNWVLEVFHPTKGGNGPKWNPEDPAAQRFMELTEAAQEEPDPEKREDLYFDAERILCEDEAIVIPMYHSVSVTITKPYVECTYNPLGIYQVHQWKIRPH